MRTNAVALRGVWGRWGFGGAEGLLGPHCPLEMREFLLHCALVVLGNADLKCPGSGSAVGEEIPALAPRLRNAKTCWKLVYFYYVVFGPQRTHTTPRWGAGKCVNSWEIIPPVGNWEQFLGFGVFTGKHCGSSWVLGLCGAVWGVKSKSAISLPKILPQRVVAARLWDCLNKKKNKKRNSYFGFALFPE
ncbi:hypothetical protein DV515_00007217 [Chloebia gouldiae]|uniref:Uncharacterized protein n=1 Tax=Chloebia gouldiae TaxID=44316 RepID=A0A3L8SJB3_CHLGU|nr:hypothetical protein DV515_00007217 [Chloebia gouldiae]